MKQNELSGNSEQLAEIRRSFSEELELVVAAAKLKYEDKENRQTCECPDGIVRFPLKYGIFLVCKKCKLLPSDEAAWRFLDEPRFYETLVDFIDE